MKIEKIEDIDFSSQEEVLFEASIISLIARGDKDKHWPFRFKAKLESSGEDIDILGWDEAFLTGLENAVPTLSLYNIYGIPSVYNGKQQIKITSLSIVPLKKSVKKNLVERETNENLKKEAQVLIKTYIKNNKIAKVVENLFVNNEAVYFTPGGTRIHHAFPGGLALHSIEVARNAVSIWKNSNTKNVDTEVLIAGALLHDIGKIKEYKENGERTLSGDLFGHIYMGAKMLYNEYSKIEGLTGQEKTKFEIIEHIILSHHGLLEMGSPVVPGVIEAVIVSEADMTSAKMDSMETALANIDKGKQSEKLITTNSKILKWN